MRCIFCKNNSDRTIGVEHIIPESLGNTEHVLPKGAVCDECNNYFGSKIEQPLLELPYFINLRHRNCIESKKKRIPTEKALLVHPQGGIIEVSPQRNGTFLNFEDEKSINLVIEGKARSIAIPIISTHQTDNIIVSRFLARTAIEALAYRLCDSYGWNEEIVDKLELDSLREYARYGKGKFWKYHQRKIYEEEEMFFNPDVSETSYQILHEFDFLYIDKSLLYFILVIMGIEYVIKMNESEIESYKRWLITNNGITPIKRGKESKAIIF
jgi:hypothetical protein